MKFIPSELREQERLFKDLHRKETKSEKLEGNKQTREM
jgi:hypothetical protein